MLKSNNTQTAQNNSKGTAQNSTRKVNIIEVDLTNSTNKVESFKKRVKASAKNIDRFPDAEIIICYEKTAPQSRERSSIQKFRLQQNEGANVYLTEGDKRKMCSHMGRIDLGLITDKKSDWLLENAKNVIMSMCIFDEQYGHPDSKYSESLGVTKEEIREFYKVVFPERAAEVEIENAINKATAEVMELIKGTMVEGESVDNYHILRVNEWGVSVEYEDGRMDSYSWNDTGFFLPFKHDLDRLFRDFFKDGHATIPSSIAFENDITISLVKGKTAHKVILQAGEMSKTFNDRDYAQMYLWVYENRHEIDKPKYAVYSYAGLYGTNMVEDVVSIAKDVLQVNYQYVRDDVNYEVVYRNEIGVTFTAASTEVINGTPFNNYWLVSRNWADFQGWNNMPPEDMCSVDLEWKVEDGVATLIKAPSEDKNYHAAI